MTEQTMSLNLPTLTPVTTSWKLETLSFHILCIMGMLHKDTLSLSFWDVDKIEIRRVHNIYFVDKVNVGNKNAAIRAYAKYVAPSFE